MSSAVREDPPKKRQTKRDCTEVVQHPADDRVKKENLKKRSPTSSTETKKKPDPPEEKEETSNYFIN